MHLTTKNLPFMKPGAIGKSTLLTIAALFAALFSNSQIPKLEWVKGIISTYYIQTSSIKTDQAGNIYTSGYFQGTVDFDPGPDSLKLTFLGGSVFISKFNSKGALIWVKNFQAGRINEIAIDNNNDLICTGFFQGSVDFDPGSSVSTLVSAGWMDIFILKLDSSGNFKWAKRIGGEDLDGIQNLALDASGNIYVDGFYNGSVDFDPGSAVFTMSATGIEYDAQKMFIAKFDNEGNFAWARNTGAANIDLSIFYKDYTKGYRSSDLEVDATGNVYSVGKFNNTQDFDPGPGTFNLSTKFGDGYITKYNSSGNFVWAKQLGAYYYAVPSAIVADTLSNIFITGAFTDTLHFDSGWSVPDLVAHDGSDIFICKLDTSGDMVWAKNIGNSTWNNFGQCIDLDISGNVYVSGGFAGTVDFDPSIGKHNITAPDTQLFIAKFTPAGNFEWVKHIEVYARKNWYQWDSKHTMIVDKIGTIYTTGYFYGTVDFDPDAGIVNLSAPGSYGGIYLHKMSSGNTGVKDISASKIKLFPNPAGTSISIDMSNSNQRYEKLEIINAKGQVCMNQDILFSDQQTDVNIENLNPGLYLIKLSNNNTYSYLKMIKQ